MRRRRRRFGARRKTRARCERGPGGGRRASRTASFVSSRRRHTSFDCDWSSGVCSSDLAETLARFPVTSDSSRGGGLADLDGDGDLDLVVGNSRNQPVALYLNDGAGVFTAADFGMTPLVDETDAGLELVDLDRDGDLDVYLPNAGAFSGGHGFAGGPDRYFRNNGQA